MEILCVLVAVGAAGAGFYAGRRTAASPTASTPVARTVGVASGDGRYRVSLVDGDLIGDGAFAAERVNEARVRGEHGRLYLDGKLLKEF